MRAVTRRAVPPLWGNASVWRRGVLVAMLVASLSLIGATQAAASGSAQITGVDVEPYLHTITVTFQAAAPAAGDRFECGVARPGSTVPYQPCSSPQVYRTLDPGSYELNVRAVSPGVAGAPAQQALSVPLEFSRCWGAASRDPRHPCQNPALASIVHPTLDDALLTPVSWCRNEQLVDPVNELKTCAFGQDPAPGVPQVALIGDSHADAMGSAMNNVATRKGWSGVALIHNGCGFSVDPMLERTAASVISCLNWAHSVIAWLAAHPSVQTIFVTANDVWVYQGSAEAGFRRTWGQLPSSVTHIYALRDPPHATLREPTCVSDALARHRRNIGTLCAVPRSRVLYQDSEAKAARDSKNPRVHEINLSPIFCGSRCFPVIGGALVLVDLEHMSQEFSATLGPYIIRDLVGQ